MRLTVAICTWNRAGHLERTLRSMMDVEIPPEVWWEILIVDNASTDRTSEVVEAFGGALPVRYLFEPRQGKTYAANRAVAEARGEAVLWTDDDVEVDAGWLRAYWTALVRFPGIGIFGGPITAVLEGSPPSWLLEARTELAPVFAELDLGPEPVPLTRDQLPYGANMAIRKGLHEAVPFDTRIGRRAGSLMGASETVLIGELMDRGARGQWVPEARIRHFIPPERQSAAYVRRFFFGVGQVLDTLREPSGPELIGQPRWVWRQAFQSEFLFRITRPWARPRVWLGHLSSASLAWGRIRGAPRARARQGTEPG